MLNLSDALFGCSFIINTLDKRKLAINIPESYIIQPDSVKVIEREGMPIHGSTFNHLKLYIKSEVRFPKKDVLNDEFKRLFTSIIKQEIILSDVNKDELFEVSIVNNKKLQSEKKKESYRESDDENYINEDDDGQQAQCVPQ